MRNKIRDLYFSALNKMVRPTSEKQFKQPTIIFSPHQDDETLGCGGTIAKKTALNVPVKVIYMTDGAKGNQNDIYHFMEPDELAAIRKREATKACKDLGVDENNIEFLYYEEGTLIENAENIIEKVTEIVRDFNAEEIYVPYARDVHPDHVATNELVTRALRGSRQHAALYEYPTWFWHRWPLVNTYIRQKPHPLHELKNEILPLLSSIFEINNIVDIKDVLEIKRTALNEHLSQMTKLIDDPNWGTLDSVSGGDWLNYFFLEYELFRKKNI